jgi:hypothetical protein
MIQGKYTILTVVFVLILAVSSAFGQTSTASLSGSVEDQAKSVIAGASVTIRNTSTGFTRNMQTSGEGRYNFVNIPTGPYEITVEAPNFAKFVQTGIVLVVNQNAVIDVEMKAGGVQEVVTVTENASLLNTTTAEVSTRFDERRLSERPDRIRERNLVLVQRRPSPLEQLHARRAGYQRSERRRRTDRDQQP